MRVLTKNTLITLLLLCISFLSMTSSSSGDKTCVDVNGNEVDWFVIFLFPTTSSPSGRLSYGYYDSNSNSPDLEFYEYNDRTFPGIRSVMSYIDDEPSNYFFWNDDASIEGRVKSAPPSKAHSKGSLIFNKNSGFLLSHSLPRFPRRNDENEVEPGFPSNAGIYAQHFICLSMDYENTLEVVKTLNIINPPLLLKVDTDKLDSGDRDIEKLIENRQDNGAGSKMTVVKTKRNNSFHIFSKSSKVKPLPWDVLIPKYYNDGFYVSTWTNPKLLESKCFGKLKVINVAKLKFSNFKYERGQEHSKWAVGIKRDVCCFGDLNRTVSQRNRGGNVICFTNSKLANIMRKGIESKDCEEKKPENANKRPAQETAEGRKTNKKRKTRS